MIELIKDALSFAFTVIFVILFAGLLYGIASLVGLV